MVIMLNANSKMAEFNGVVVVIRGQEVDLSDLTYNEFSELMNSLTDDEIQEVLDQIVEEVGEEAFMKFIVNLQTLAAEEELAEEEGDSVREKRQPQREERPRSPQGKQQAPVLDPVRFVDMNDFFSYDPEIVVRGIDSVSEQVGKYMAFVNAGLTNEQAYELITIEAKRAHELAMADKQLELEQIKADNHLRGASVKQILNR
jgi:hypothetical protein